MDPLTNRLQMSHDVISTQHQTVRGPHMHTITYGIDLAKNVFQVHAVNTDGEIILKRKLKRKEVLAFFAKQELGLIGIEACGGSHYWARELSKLGFTVRMMSPQFVKPYIKGNKNDANDAEGICEAVTRPNMKFVTVKTTGQQDILMLHRIRTQRIKQRTALSNQARGLLSEYGIVIPVGIRNVRKDLIDILTDIEEKRLSEFVKPHFNNLYEELLYLDDLIQTVDKALKVYFNQNEACQRLASLPGISIITATALVGYLGDISNFKSGRELAAYLGLVSKQHSSGGRELLLGISKRGDSYLRTLLIHGSRSVLKVAATKKDKDSLWLMDVQGRRGFNKAAVAQANKTARRVWALLSNKTQYEVQQAA